MLARLTLLVVTILSAPACKRPEALQLGTTQRKVVLSLSLAHDTAAGSTTCPILHVDVNGRPTRFIVDTGATYHAITKWFGEDLGIATRRYTEDAARDYVGSPIEVARSSPLDILTGETVLVRKGMIPVVATPVLGRQLGIGGVLSPRLLLQPLFTVVLDLRGDRLVVVGGALGHTDPWGSKSIAPNGMQLCETKGAYLVPTEAYGTSALLRLDTGSQETHIFANSKLGQILLSELARASGARSSVSQQLQVRVPGLALHAGNVRMKIDVLVVAGEPSSECPYDGLLGMDLLKRCTVALDQESGFARCD